MSPLLIASLVILVYMLMFIIFPIMTLIQCLIDDRRSGGKKFLWIVFILVTWPLLIVGSLIFSLVTYSPQWKFVPLTAVIVIVGASALGSGYMGKQFAFAAFAMGEKSIESGFDKESIPLPVKTRLRDNLNVLKDEMAATPDLGDKYNAITDFLPTAIKGGLTDTELKDWDYLFTNRATLDEAKIREFFDARRPPEPDQPKDH